MELRSPDALSNPYISCALLIYAGIEGIDAKMKAPPASDFNLYSATEAQLNGIETLPESLEEANRIASNSEFVKAILPQRVIDTYTL